MIPDQSWPVVLDKGTYALDVDGSAKGRTVGVIHQFTDEMITEAWRFTSRAPVKLDGDPQSIDQALALFYRHNAIRTPPAPGWLRQLAKHGRPQWAPSVQWWGCSQPRPCACYADGLVEAHLFRWEGSRPGLRRVLTMLERVSGVAPRDPGGCRMTTTTIETFQPQVSPLYDRANRQCN